MDSMIPERLHEPLEFAALELKGMLRTEEPEDERLVQKGLMLYRQGLVYQLRFESDSVLGVVQDVTPAKVKLDLEFINLSECSCPAEGFCRHRMAVFFELLSKAQSVSDWVDEWRLPIKERKAAKEVGLKKAKELGLLRASDLLKTAQQKPDYDRWISSFAESFDTIMNGIKNPAPYMIPDLYQVYSRKWKAGAPYEQEWKHLYHLVGNIFSFKKLMELSSKLGHNSEMVNRYYNQIFQRIMDETENVMNKLSVQSLPFAFDEFIEKLKDDSAALLTAEFAIEFERTQLYRLLWTKFFKKKDWSAEEVKKLLRTKNRSFPIIMGLVHQYITLREDKKALDLLSVPDTMQVPYFPLWLNQFTANKEWERMGPYTEEYIKKIKDYLSLSDDYYAKLNYMRFVTKTIKPYCTEANRADLYETALVEMLPYSYTEYEYTLFDNQEYDKWLDLQAIMGNDIDYLGSGRVKVIEKENPALLLPLYHQAVHNHIAHKGRDHYREAVRKMKKLRTLYKKLKRQDDWEFYLEALLEQTKRLRAFHEECRRGKLINA